MLTLRPTKTLARRMALSFEPVGGTVSNPYADWCLHSFTFSSYRYLIAVNRARRSHSSPGILNRHQFE